jgi:hypothetical protein
MGLPSPSARFGLVPKRGKKADFQYDADYCRCKHDFNERHRHPTRTDLGDDIPLSDDIDVGFRNERPPPQDTFIRNIVGQWAKLPSGVPPF